MLRGFPLPYILCRKGLDCREKKAESAWKELNVYTRITETE